jgi:hypothetical protein
LTYEITITGIAPYNKIKELNAKVAADSTYFKSTSNWYSDSSLYHLAIERSRKQALLKQAEGDSIGLTLDLQDSMVIITLKGVQIYSSKASYLKNEKLFYKLPIATRVKIFSQPIEIITQKTTIVKEPFVNRTVPKDTIEAAANAAYKPDTLKQDPAFLELKTQYGFDIVLEQEQLLDGTEKYAGLDFHYKRQKALVMQTLKCMKEFKVPEYTPFINIKIPASELRAIYRAIPYKAKVVILL